MKHLNIIIIALSLSVLCSCSVSEKIHAKRYEIQSNTTKTEAKPETAEHLALIEVKDEHPSEEVMDDSKVITDTQKETLGEQLRELDAITNTNKFYSHVFEALSKNETVQKLNQQQESKNDPAIAEGDTIDKLRQSKNIGAAFASLGAGASGAATAITTLINIHDTFSFAGMAIASIFVILAFYFGIFALIRFAYKKSPYKVFAILGIILGFLTAFVIAGYVLYDKVRGLP